MEVKLIASTENLLDVVYTGARTCYNPGSPIDMWKETPFIKQDKMLKLIESVIKSGHLSVLEHSQFTFAIEGISRACSHQLVRHRLCSFSQQSQRYVEIKEDLKEISKLYYAQEYNDIINKYFVMPNDNAYTKGFLFDVLQTYLVLIEKGYKPEDARAVLPNCTKTNIVMTCNLRELMHLANERLCSHAQLEIRQLVKLMANEVVNKEAWLKPYLVPKCEMLGYCNEKNSCGRKGRLND